jgi:tetratricopeptide (TPR) repeat protein
MGLFQKLFGGSKPAGDRSWEELNTEGACAIKAGRDSEAVRLLEGAIKVARASGRETPELASSLTNLAVALERKGDFARAERSFKDALRIAEATRGKDHPHTGSVLNLMSQFYFRRGKVDDAKQLIDRAEAIERGKQ